MGDGGGAEAEPDDRSLVERARADADAFAVLYRRYVAPVHAFAYRRSGSKEVAEDVTAATFERALRHLDGFRWRSGGFRAWLFRIAANELADHHRAAFRERGERGQRALRRLWPEDQDDPFDRVERLVDLPAEQLLGALDGLHPSYQQAISLRYLSGLEADEAAAAMQCSKPVLAVTLHRGLRALRRALEGS